MSVNLNDHKSQNYDENSQNIEGNALLSKTDSQSINGHKSVNNNIIDDLKNSIFFESNGTIKSLNNNFKHSDEGTFPRDEKKLSAQNKEKLKNMLIMNLKYYILINEYKRYDKFNLNQNKYYLINKQWINSWKGYFQYSSFKAYFEKTKFPKDLIDLGEEMTFKMDYLEKIALDAWKYFEENNFAVSDDIDPPGIISNYQLFQKIDENCEGDYFSNKSNFFLCPRLMINKHYLVFNEKLWNLFYREYGADPIIVREKIKYTDVNRIKEELEINQLSLKIIVFPQRNQVKKEDIINPIRLNVIISHNKFLNDLKFEIKERLIEYIKRKEYLDSEEQLNDQDSNKVNETINFYQTLKYEHFNVSKFVDVNSLDFNYFCNFLIQKLEKLQSESNFSIKIPKVVENLEYDKQNYLVNMNIKTQDVLLVELAESENSSPLFFKSLQTYPQGECCICYKNKTLYFSCICEKVAYCSKRCYGYFSDHKNNCYYAKFENHKVSENENSKYGLCGLSNIGNTCYMNTALQCLSNCQELVKYFIGGSYLNHINIYNPLSTKGELSDAFCFLLKLLWFGDRDSFPPYSFKNYIGSLKTMYSGYDQNDSHEFLNFLLDNLNEDLNRVIEKPLIKITKEHEEETDSFKKSKFYWTNFKRRNQSIITDLFYGQYKSTLKCPECNHISTAFDPFLSLTLPIPQKVSFTFELYFVFFNLQKQPLKFSITSSKSIKIFQLRKFLARKLEINPFSFLIYLIDSPGINKILNATEAIDTSNSNKRFFCIEIDPNIYYEYRNKKEILKNQYERNFLQSNAQQAMKYEYLSLNSDKYCTDDIIEIGISDIYSKHIDNVHTSAQELYENYCKNKLQETEIFTEIINENTVDEESFSELSPTNKVIGAYTSFDNNNKENQIYQIISDLIDNIFKLKYKDKVVALQNIYSYLIKDEITKKKLAQNPVNASNSNQETCKNKINENDQCKIKSHSAQENFQLNRLTDKINFYHNGNPNNKEEIECIDIEQNGSNCDDNETELQEYLKDIIREKISLIDKIKIINDFNILLRDNKLFNSLAYHSDENYFLNENFIRVVIHFKKYDATKLNGNFKNTLSKESFFNTLGNFGPSLIIYLNKNWSMNFVQVYIFEFLKNLIQKNKELLKNKDNFINPINKRGDKFDLYLKNEIAYLLLVNPIFEKRAVKKANLDHKVSVQINTSQENIKYCSNELNNSENINENPKFILNQIYYQDLLGSNHTSDIFEEEEKAEKSQNKKEVYQDTNNIKVEKQINVCVFCENENCQGCPLDDNDNITLQAYLNKITKSKDIEDFFTNDYYYLHENIRSKNFTTSDFQLSSNSKNAIKNDDFMLSVIFNPEYNKNLESLRILYPNYFNFNLDQGSDVSLINCFESFHKEEKLECSNEWKCSKCCKNQQATKKLEISRIPKILIIHLNRFSHFSNRKINTQINFPVKNLNLNNFVKYKKLKNPENPKSYEDQNYDLFAIANHYGELGGGHYTANAKNPMKNGWFTFNDGSVSHIQEKDLDGSSAYLLFYRKKDLSEDQVNNSYTKCLKLYDY